MNKITKELVFKRCGVNQFLIDVFYFVRYKKENIKFFLSSARLLLITMNFNYQLVFILAVLMVLVAVITEASVPVSSCDYACSHGSPTGCCKSAGYSSGSCWSGHAACSD